MRGTDKFVKEKGKGLTAARGTRRSLKVDDNSDSKTGSEVEERKNERKSERKNERKNKRKEKEQEKETHAYSSSLA